MPLPNLRLAKMVFLGSKCKNWWECRDIHLKLQKQVAFFWSSIQGSFSTGKQAIKIFFQIRPRWPGYDKGFWNGKQHKIGHVQWFYGWNWAIKNYSNFLARWHIVLTNFLSAGVPWYQMKKITEIKSLQSSVVQIFTSRAVVIFVLFGVLANSQEFV